MKWRWAAKRSRRRKQRKFWMNKRAEEARDKIYRLPPPGNGNTKQTNITDFFSLRISHLSPNNETGNNVGIRNYAPQCIRKLSINILQWNACSLNEEKNVQLERLTVQKKIDIVCISELGRYRKIKGFPHYEQSNKQTQSAVFLEKCNASTGYTNYIQPEI